MDASGIEGIGQYKQSVSHENAVFMRFCQIMQWAGSGAASTEMQSADSDLATAHEPARATVRCSRMLSTTRLITLKRHNS